MNDCSECGERLIEDARFCSACGRRVVHEPPQRAVMQPPPMPRGRINEPSPFSPPPLQRAPRRSMRPPPPDSAGPQLTGVSRALYRVGPVGMVMLGVVVAIAAYWSASRDDAAAKTQAAHRMSVATGPLPTTSQEVTPAVGAFSTRQALQGLYGAYDPHLDGVFWSVKGAPGEWADWNGKRVFIKPLISRTDDSGTRHVLVTNSVEVRDGLVVKQGAACRECQSLLGAALYERRGDAWLLVTEHRFMKIAGAWGAPPKVTVDFPRNAGVEVRIEDPLAQTRRGRNSVHAVILHGGTPSATSAAGTRISTSR